jgi:two-component system chemotaxis response regulator CheB
VALTLSSNNVIGTSSQSRVADRLLLRRCCRSEPPQLYAWLCYVAPMSQGSPWFVAIGASGSEGLDGIKTLLNLLQRPVQAVGMVVLHRPSGKISHLGEVLARKCGIEIVLADDAEILEEGTCYIGEPDGHLTLVDTHLAHLVSGAGNRLRGQTIDVLFESLAAHSGARAVGIVLSGALDDGSRGLAAIHAAGGTIMVLDPGRKLRGMQQNAIDYGERM